MLRLSSDGVVLYANDAAARAFGVAGGTAAPPAIAEAARRAASAATRIRTEIEAAGVVFSASVVPVGDEVNLCAQDIPARRSSSCTAGPSARRAWGQDGGPSS